MAENERLVTPRSRALAHASEGSPSVAGSAQDAVIASLQERLSRMEEQGQYHGGSGAEVMARAITKQTEFMEKMMTQKPQETRRGMIRIDPKMQWPTLHDTDM